MLAEKFCKNYLSGHVHWVKADDRYSDWGSMRGIPQGSALFLISKVTDGVLLPYADDTTLVYSRTISCCC